MNGSQSRAALALFKQFAHFAMSKQCKLRNRITVATKLEIIDQLRSNLSRKVVKLYGVSRSNVMEWKRQEAELRVTRRNACRLPGGSAKIVGEQLHQVLTEKILYERSAQRRVRRGMIALWANEIKANLNLLVSVCPSSIDRFVARGSFVMRKGTRKSVLDDDQIIERGALFISQVRNIIDKHAVQLSSIYNMDETAVIFDHSKSTTVHAKGSKDVPIQSFGVKSSVLLPCSVQVQLVRSGYPTSWSRHPPSQNRTPSQLTTVSQSYEWGHPG